MEKIIVADSDARYRKGVAGALNRAGYKVFEATDGAGLLRLAHTIHPELILLDTKLKGMDAFEVGEILEKQELSTVMYMTLQPDDFFFRRIQEMTLGYYLQKPLRLEQLYGNVKVAIQTGKQIQAMNKRILQLEKKLAQEKTISKAKLMLMVEKAMTEEEAYDYLRKASMDRCIKLEEMAQEILVQGKGDGTKV